MCLQRNELDCAKDSFHVFAPSIRCELRQLHARGGQEEETTNAEAIKNPLTSLRFWVPIFDGIVWPGNRTAAPLALSQLRFRSLPVRFLGFIAEIYNISKQPARTQTVSHSLQFSSTFNVHVFWSTIFDEHRRIESWSHWAVSSAPDLCVFAVLFCMFCHENSHLVPGLASDNCQGLQAHGATSRDRSIQFLDSCWGLSLRERI